MADVHSLLDELTDLVESAKAVPLSASCVVNRSEVVARLDAVREALPEELARAKWLLQDREEVVEEGRREAERIVAAAQQERARLLARTDIAQEAATEAERIVAEARDTARLMRLEVEDYVDAKLANFEVVLQKTLGAVERGRAKLRGENELDRLGDDLAETPLP